jgi:hypothetical protein
VTPPPGRMIPPLALVLSSAGLSSASFRAANAGASLARKSNTGTTVTYQDSESATTTFSVFKQVAGHKRGRSCVAGKKHERQRACARSVAVGSFTHADSAGSVTVHFTGRVNAAKLRPGRYTLMLTPYASGLSGPTIALSFRILG